MLSHHLHSTLNKTLKFLMLTILVTSIEAFLFLNIQADQQYYYYYYYHSFKNIPISHFLFFFCSFLVLSLLLLIKTYYFLRNSQVVYIVDFSCYKPPCFCRVPFSSFLENASKMSAFDTESVSFMSKILHSSGQGQQTYLPPALHYIPPKTHHQESIVESQMLLFPVIQNLLSKTNLSPHHIDILITNCSGFSPSPSLSSLIVNKFSMRTDIKSFNISGMGCSASALAIDMAQSLLRTHKRDSYALVLSTESLSTGWYSGHQKPKLLLNCLFRMGSAAILLTNKKQVKSKYKYKIFCTVRTNRAFDDKAYSAAVREEDSAGKLGVTLNRDLLQVAGESLRENVTALGSKILPFKELLRLSVSILIKKRPYVPDFKSAVQHFCLPVSGRAVIREIARNLKLGERDIEGALMTLHRFGNQSSSSLWYELAYVEAKDRVKKGDMVWLIGLGTGSKCNSVVLECLSPIVGESVKGPWADCIHECPIQD